MSEQMTMTTEQVAEHLHCSVKTVRAMRKSGLLQGFKLGRGYLYTCDEIVDLLAYLQGKTIDSYGDMCILAKQRKSRPHRNRKQANGSTMRTHTF